MTIYSRGRAFEYRVRDFLKRNGWFVIRSAGSKTPVDLAAFKSNRTVFLQCKASKTPTLAKKERKALIMLKRTLRIEVGIAYRGPGNAIAFRSIDSLRPLLGDLP